MARSKKFSVCQLNYFLVLRKVDKKISVVSGAPQEKEAYILYKVWASGVGLQQNFNLTTQHNTNMMISL